MRDSATAILYQAPRTPDHPHLCPLASPASPASPRCTSAPGHPRIPPSTWRPG